MGKKRHSKDRLFITTTEHKYEWGGKKEESKIPIAKLPYFCCSLSLLPFENPVCSPDGIVFDITNIIPFIKKYKKNPVTGLPLKVADLIKLNFHKNVKGEYHDPVSFKIFSDFTHIVALKTSGNVFAFDTVDELNKKAKHWKDLITDESFTAKDIITLQDPLNLEKRTVANFDFIKNEISIEFEPNKVASINQNNTGKRILAELKENSENPETKENIIKKLKLDKEDKIEYKITEKDKNSTNFYVQETLKNKNLRHELFTTNEVSGSFTSTKVNAANQSEYRVLSEQEIRSLYYNDIKIHHKKGFVQINTNFGGINLEIHCDQTPKAAENFIELCEKRYFNNLKFHRLIHYFCIQGGDPTGTGKGGESIFGSKFEDEFHPKLSHNKAGILSMANSGKNSNGSQFFITLGECRHLDNKHTIFGEVVGGLPILDIFNKIETDEKERPKIDIEIKDTLVFSNPFRETIKSFKENEEKKLKEDSEKKEEKNFWLEKEQKLFSLKTKESIQNKDNSGLTKFLFDSFELKNISDSKNMKKNK